MSESCSGNCASCGSDCGERKAESLLAQLNSKSQVKKVIAVVSGKGGVGKSTVTAQLAVAMARKGHRVGILDADITGPSIPKAFGVSECRGVRGTLHLEREKGPEIRGSCRKLFCGDATQVRLLHRKQPHVCTILFLYQTGAGASRRLRLR